MFLEEYLGADLIVHLGKSVRLFSLANYKARPSVGESRKPLKSKIQSQTKPHNHWQQLSAPVRQLVAALRTDKQD
jgi:hypothetical protein